MTWNQSTIHYQKTTSQWRGINQQYTTKKQQHKTTHHSSKYCVDWWVHLAKSLNTYFGAMTGPWNRTTRVETHVDSC